MLAATLLVLAFQGYSRAMNGPFLFDDLVLPFASPFYGQAPLLTWISGSRPVLMLTYWMNYQTSELSTYGYHLTNVLLHALNALLVFALCERLFRLFINDSRRVLIAAALSCSLFFLHPLQTESVAWVAGRSEVLSATFVLSAWLIYVRRIGSPVTTRQALVILALFGLAAAAKEQSVATLPAILLLTDWIVRRGSMKDEIRANRRLYIPLTVGVAAGGAWVASVLLASKSAGAGTGISPFDYLFTEARAILVYLRLFVVPFGQNADPDFPMSHTIFEHGAAFAMGAILIGCFVILRQAPLIRYGWFLFLAFLAPVSSILPLVDPLVEHRMYLPIVGLSIAVSAALAQLRVPNRRLAMAGVLCSAMAFIGTARRSDVWSDGILFWQDVVAKSPQKARGYQHLTHMYVAAGRCGEAVRRLERAGGVASGDYFILLNWADAYQCEGRPDAALDKLRTAARLESTADVYGRIGAILIEEGRVADASQAFKTALAKEPPGTDLAYVYEGNLALLGDNVRGAVEAAQRALSVNPWSPEAATLLRLIRSSTARSDASSVVLEPGSGL